jgi:hypothetical protein
MLDRTFADCVEVGYWVEEDNEIGDDAFRLRNFRSKEVDLVCECTREPLLADVITLRTYALGSFQDCGTKVGASTDKYYSPVPRSDGSDEGGGAAKMGKGALKVYDSDTGTRSVCIWDEIWIKQGAVMAKVRSSGEKGRESQVAWGRWTV